MMAAKTGSKASCPVYGAMCDLPDNQLPSTAHVIHFYAKRQSELPKTTLSSKIITDVAISAMGIWIKAGIPTDTLQRNEQKIETLQCELRNVLKKKGEQKKNSIEHLSAEGKKLFDIAACHCEQFDFCTYPKDRKVPPAERTFLEDQRPNRKMVIRTIDKQASEALRKKRIRTEKREQYYSKVAKLDEGPSTSLNHSSIEKYIGDSDSSNSDSASEDIYENEESAITAKNLMPLSTLSSAGCSRMLQH